MYTLNFLSNYFLAIITNSHFTPFVAIHIYIFLSIKGFILKLYLKLTQSCIKERVSGGF